MKFEFYISRRIYKTKTYKHNVSSPVVRIAVAAVAIGMTVMLVSMATGMGLQRKIQENIAAFQGHIQVVPCGRQGQMDSMPMMSDTAFVASARTIPGVRQVQSFALRAGIVRSGRDFEGMVLKGVGPDYNLDLFGHFIREGKVPDFSLGRYNDTILLSRKTAAMLGLSLHDKVKMYFVRDEGVPLQRNFTVGALFDTGISEYDNNYLIGDIRHVARINRWEPGQIGGYEIALGDIKDIEKTMPAVQAASRWEMCPQSMFEYQKGILDWVAMFDTNIYLILVVMTVICGVNIVCVLLILILENSSLIGLLRGLGASAAAVSRIFILNAFYIVARGLLWGNSVGIGLLLLQKYTGILKLDPDTYFVSTVPVYLSPGWILLLNAGVSSACILFMVLPSLLVAHVRPSKVLKYD